MNHPTKSQSPIFPISMLLCLFGLMTPGICQAAAGAGAPALIDQDCETVLNKAVAYDNLIHLQELLADQKLPFDEIINIPNRYDRTALQRAAQHVGTDMLQALVAFDKVTPEILNKRTQTGMSALHLLSRNPGVSPAGIYTTTLMILNKKNPQHPRHFTDIDTPGEGFTPLHWAVVGQAHLYARNKEDLAAGKPNIFSALLGRAITTKVDKDGPIADAIKTYGLDSDECQALIADQAQRNSDTALIDATARGAAQETDADDDITHEDQLRRTVDPNVGSVGRSSELYALI